MLFLPIERAVAEEVEYVVAAFESFFDGAEGAGLGHEGQLETESCGDVTQPRGFFFDLDRLETVRVQALRIGDRDQDPQGPLEDRRAR